MTTPELNKFLTWKSQALSGVDLSRKGEIDEPIIDLVNIINQHNDYFTTSSCSGRCILFEEEHADIVQKKGCRWLYTTHKHCKTEESLAVNESSGDAFFKFEPFVMHIQCRTIQQAQDMHAAAVASGFRNSGITIGKKGKIVTAIRSTHGLEVPVTLCGKLLVSDDYIAHITRLANIRMEENMKRIHRFNTNVKALTESHRSIKDTEPSKSDKKTREHKNFKSSSEHLNFQKIKQHHKEIANDPENNMESGQTLFENMFDVG